MRRIRWDTYVGMGFSNLIAFFIILSTAATLHAAGIVDIQTSAQAAEALRPLGGPTDHVLVVQLGDHRHGQPSPPDDRTERLNTKAPGSSGWR
jgi:hypothetical protein